MNKMGQVTVPSRTLPEEQPEHLTLTELYAKLTGTGVERGLARPDTCADGLRSQAASATALLGGTGVAHNEQCRELIEREREMVYCE